MNFTTKDTKNTKGPEWSEHLELLGRGVVDSAFKVHSQLGPGLLESVYETCMFHELKKRGIAAQRQVPVPIVYDGIEIDTALRLDILADNQVVIEIKSVDKLLPIHKAQVLTYLKLTGNRIGFLINFNVPRIREGLCRLVY